MQVNVTRTFKKIVKMQYRDGQLWVTANYFVSRGKLIKIIEEHFDWIRSRKKEESERLAKLSEAPAAAPQQQVAAYKAELPPAEDLYSGRKTLILGEIFNVCCGFGSRPYVEGRKLFLPEQQFYAREKRLRCIKSYLKKTCDMSVAAEIADYGSKISLCPAKIEFRDVQDGWLKCNSAAQKIICLDYRVAQLPKNLRHYIIAHAFAHFGGAAHDNAFWTDMRNRVSDLTECTELSERYLYLKDVK